MTEEFKNDEKALRQALVETGVVSEAAFAECIAVHEQVRAMGVEPEPLLDVLVQKGHLDRARATSLAAESSAHASHSALEIPGYEILGTIGKGGMGTVYKGYQKSMARDVAIKVLFPETARIPGYVERFFHEARMAAKVKHTNIVGAFDVGEIAGHYYLVMEYFPGRTLKEIIFEHEKIPVEKSLDIGMQMARALENAYANKLVHRDIKPENVMMNDEGVAKLCDMGLARETVPDPQGKRELAGTPLYISPEQARGRADVDIRSDIYSLGATLYHMILGRPPYLGTDPRRILRAHIEEPLVPPAKRDPSVPKAISDLIVKMMAKSPDQRHLNPTALHAHMQRIRDALDARGSAPAAKPGGSAQKTAVEVVAKEAGPEQPKIRSRRRRISKSQGAMWAVIAAAIIGAVVIAAMLKGGGQEEPRKTGDGDSQPARRDPQPRLPDSPSSPPPDKTHKAPEFPADAARQAMSLADAHLAAHPEDFEGALDRLKEARVKAAGSEVEKTVADRIAQVESMRAQAREKGARDAVVKSVELVAAGRPGAAVDLLTGWVQREGLSPETRETTGKALNDAADALLDRWTVDKNSIELLAKRMEFDEALELAAAAVAPGTGYGTFESILSESGDDVRSLTAGIASAKSEFVRRAAAEEAPKFLKLESGVTGLMATGMIPGAKQEVPLPLAARPPAALAFCEEALLDPVLKKASPKARGLKSDLALTVDLLESAPAGIRALAAKGHKAAMKGQQTLRRILGVEESGGDQVVVLDAPRIKIGLRSFLHDVSEPDLLAVLEAAAVTRGAKPEDSLALALLCVWSTPGAVPGCADQASAHMVKAEASGLDVSRYRAALDSRMGMLGAAEVTAGIEAALAAAKETDKKKAEAVYKALESLITEYKDSPALAARRAEIESAMADLRRRFPASVAVSVPFLATGLLFFDPARKAFEVSYDFNKQSELEDWAVRTHGDRPEQWFQIILDRDLGREQNLSLKSGKISFSGGGYLCFEPRLTGDVLFEIEFAAMETPGILVFIVASDTGGYCYNTGMNWVQLSAMGGQAGMQIPAMVAEGLSTFDLKWPHRVSLLEGRGEIVKARQAYRLVIARGGDRISADLYDSRGKSLVSLEKRDSAHKDGRVGVALLKSSVIIEKAYIKGTFEERWHRSAEAGRKSGERGDMPGDAAK